MISLRLLIITITYFLYSAINLTTYESVDARLNPQTVILLDPQNIGIVIGISLLSCIQAEIYVILYALLITTYRPPSLIFTTYPDMASVHTCLTVFLDLRKWQFPLEVCS